ncbi:hypothetical protein [Enterococcus sp. AD013-P3]|uniref:hypothetical protein n=1 Tax=Enterococcus sp. AD013-P3 TaxID=3411036 RepID=UPI003B9322C0
MPFVALLLDLLAAGSYFVQLYFFPNKGLELIGILIQSALTIGLLWLMFRYRGPRHSNFQPEGYSYFTIRYGIIVLSFILNGILLFLYGLNLFGGNDLIFSAF